jgi:hypothetical protein
MEQDIWYRASRTEHLGMEICDRTSGKDILGQDIRDRKSGTGHLVQDNEERTTEIGWNGQVGLTGHPVAGQRGKDGRNMTMFGKCIFSRK